MANVQVRKKQKNQKVLRNMLALTVGMCGVALAMHACSAVLSGKDDYMTTNLKVTSEAFADDGYMPVKYTGQAEEISPPLEWESVDPAAETIAIIMDDPALPFVTITHWLLWNIPANITKIPENISDGKVVTSLPGACQGKNFYQNFGYMGPKPPFGTHTYRFHVYALDTVLDLEPEAASKKQLHKAMEGHILQYGILRGKFSH
jgi:Raf kinase inhibitor-like YbhB/YbcL family protein